jgi:hypothetical protein
MATARKVVLGEIMGLQRYEEVREDSRRRIIALKRNRRLAVGDRITFVFENHDTMWFQIQEMLRAEHIVDLDRIRDELAVYNELIPSSDELSATMFIEITDSKDIRAALTRFLGIERHVHLEIGSHRIPALFEAGRSKEDKISAVQYVRFKLSADAIAALKCQTAVARLVIDHPQYQHSAVMPAAMCASLGDDLETAA